MKRLYILLVFLISLHNIYCFKNQLVKKFLRHYPLKESFAQTKEGVLRGQYDAPKKYYTFTGIRYGQAPIKESRFSRALPENPWKGVKNALIPGPACPQIHAWTRLFVGNEDCLFVNLFTPVMPYDRNFTAYLPVIFYIHGGAFQYGSGYDFLQDPQYLVEKGVVVVTVNYRLGPLGFLCVGKNARGNMGIHDLILALKWVQRNIQAFGGDPRKVTIMAFSAGAAALDILKVSQKTGNLFSKSISISGSILNPWVFVKNPVDIGFRLAQALGFTGNSIQLMVDFLKNVPIKDLVEKSIKIKSPVDDRNVLEHNFTPCLNEMNNDDDPYYEPILTKNPIDILRYGNYRKIPQIYGITATEGLFFIKNSLYPAASKANLNRNDYFFLPTNLNLPATPSQSQHLATKIKQTYLQSRDSSSYADSLVKYTGDSFITHGVTQAARQHVQNGNKQVFVYRFDFEGAFNFVKRVIGHPNEPGVSHGDDLGYVFSDLPIAYVRFDMKNSTAEIKVRDRMVTMWTNFAKYE